MVAVSNETEVSKMIGVRMSKELLAEVKRIAERDCCSVSSVIKRACRQYIEDYERDEQ